MSGADLTTSRASPVVDYTSQDFDAIRQDLITYAQSKYTETWTDFNSGQFAIIFLEMLAYMGDLLSFQLNATVREAFIATVQRRGNVNNLGKMVNFQLADPIAATVDLTLTLNPSATYPLTIDRDNIFANRANGADQVTFQPAGSTVVPSYPGGGTVSIAAIEGAYFDLEVIGASSGGPGQRWQFPQQDVILDSVALYVGPTLWTRVNNFLSFSSSAQVYRLVRTDDGETYAVFGDGVYGQVPTVASPITVSFRTGGGRRGNLQPNAITIRVNAIADILSVNNPLSSSGGDDAQTVKSGKNAIASGFITQDRGVSAADYEQLVLGIAGVAKARAGEGQPPGSRIISIWVAPSGGGAPTSLLRSNILSALAGKRMVTNRLRVLSPTYKDIRVSVLLHVNDGFRAAESSRVSRNGLLNSFGTGLLDFEQLDFSGTAVDPNGGIDLLISQTRLHEYFSSIATAAGLDRIEIKQLDVVPVARARAEGNQGDGTVNTITTNGRQRRREYAIQLISSAQFYVYERLVGYVSTLTDNTLVDDDATFDTEAITNYPDYQLIPTTQGGTPLNVLSATGQTVTIDPGQSSLFAVTEVGTPYALYLPTPGIGNVGTPFTSPDGAVTFTVTAGTSAFVAGDAFSLDVFPVVGDIRLRADEYPQLTDVNLVTRTSGGARI